MRQAGVGGESGAAVGNRTRPGCRLGPFAAEAAGACNGVLFGHSKKDILPFAVAWMDPVGVMPSD